MMIEFKSSLAAKEGMYPLCRKFLSSIPFEFSGGIRERCFGPLTSVFENKAQAIAELDAIKDVEFDSIMIQNEGIRAGLYATEKPDEFYLVAIESKTKQETLVQVIDLINKAFN